MNAWTDIDARISESDCRQLWCSVLLLAIEDARAMRPKMPSESDGDWQRRVNTFHISRRYIGSRGFREVCHLAGMDPDATAERVQKGMGDA